jgi:hypothetical protein
MSGVPERGRKSPTIPHGQKGPVCTPPTGKGNGATVEPRPGELERLGLADEDDTGTEDDTDDTGTDDAGTEDDSGDTGTE